MIAPPPLKDDCFALPPGVDWTPVDEALTRLRRRLRTVTGVETVPVVRALGRVLAQDVHARRSNPPAPNAAVDGYGFAHAALSAPPHHLPLHPGRAAAGIPFEGPVPAGHALRILTGAMLPKGVDTVVLEEDAAVGEAAAIAFQGEIKQGANTRQVGEDVAAGDLALPAGHVLRPHDFALLTALGVIEIQVRKRLRVGVLSTGDELVEPGNEIGSDKIFDANRPMLLALAEVWGFEPVDLGRAPDRSTAVRECLEQATQRTDAILTSGGASAGDEDHISAILRTYGIMNDWRIAMKPGRPLALAMWQGVPVFGLPGNPVAAFVCALIFARPALKLLSGAGWSQPLAMSVPAAFEKHKKPGRREYLRARLDAQGRARVFRSEGSGRISGLSWAEGLIELPDGGMRIAEGTPVRFLPYSGFGL